jgi:hypothetical protein
MDNQVKWLEDALERAITENETKNDFWQRKREKATERWRELV